MVSEVVFQRGRAIAVGLALTAVLLGPIRSVAQLSPSLFPRAPRAQRQRLARAEKALREERFGDAIRELHAVLAGAAALEGQQTDYFVTRSDPMDPQTSIKNEAQRLIGAMPRQGLDLYELQFGAAARALLDDAVRTTNMGMLNEVVRRYFHTRAGYEAMLLLGRLHLDNDQPLAAALCFRRLGETPAAAAQFDPEVSILLAACWYYARRPELAAGTLAAVSQRHPNRKIQIGGLESDPLPQAGRELPWLEAHFRVRPELLGGPGEWLVHRGDPTRNAATQGGMPLATLRWRSPTAELESDELLIRDIQKSGLHQGAAGLLSLSPLAVDDVVLMRSPDRMLAIDFTTGKRVWKYPWGDSSHFSIATTRRGTTLTQEADQRRAQLQQRLWQDVPYGQISSDGSQVYLLDDLRFAQERNLNARLMPGGARRLISPRRHNQLVALDLKRQGALKWTVGGETGLNDQRLAGAFFLAVPLPLNGDLYVLAELDSAIHLIALDSETGQQLWSQQLVQVARRGVSDYRRRLAGASPSHTDGVLVCPTSAGATVAIELSSRSLLWGYQYPMPSPSGRIRPGRIPRRTDPSTSDRWLDTTATIANGAVVVTPLETNKLYCLDLLTGETSWPPLDIQSELPGPRFVACVFQGKVILVGRNSLLALNLSDGKPAWPNPVQLDASLGEMPSGRGFQTDRYYFLPTTSERLLKVDLAAGKIVDRTPTDGILGNLICYKDEVISHGTDSLTTFYQIEPLRERVRQRLRVAADDPWALARQGELFINEGRLEEALVSLRRAYELQSDDLGVRTLLVDTLLSALRGDFANYETVAEELEQLIDRKTQRLEYLHLMAAGLHSTGKFNEAVEKYFELADLAIAELEDDEPRPLAEIRFDPQGVARLDRWLKTRLGELFADADDAVAASITRRVRGHWQRLKEGSPDRLRTFLAFFDFHPLARVAMHDLAVRAAESKAPLEAELLISRLASQFSPEAAAKTAADVAAQLRHLKEYERAADFYGMLAHRWPSADLGGQRTAESLLVDVAQSEPFQDLMKTRTWPYGAVRFSEGGARPRPRSPLSSIPIMRSRAEFNDVQYSVRFRPSQTGAVILVHGGLGQLVAQATLPKVRVGDSGFNFGERNGHLLVTTLEDSIVAMDLFRSPMREKEALLWSDQLAPRLSAGSRSRTQRAVQPANPLTGAPQRSAQPAIGVLGTVNANGVVYLKSRSLVCVDPLTRQQLWERKNIARDAEVFGDEDFVFVSVRNSPHADVFSAADGRQLGTRAVPQNRWTTQGRFILGWEVQDDSIRLFQYDAWLEEEQWSEVFASGSRGALNATSVAVVEPSGRLIIRSLNSNSVEVAVGLEPEPSLNTVQLLASSQQYLLVTDTGAKRDLRLASWLQSSAPVMTGRVYAFSRKNGAPMWQSPVEIENAGIPLRQPAECPSLWFIRRATSKTRTAVAGSRLKVYCLDRRDGRTLLERDVTVTRPSNREFEVDRDSQAVTMILHNATLRLEFSDAPVPPQPPARIR